MWANGERDKDKEDVVRRSGPREAEAWAKLPGWETETHVNILTKGREKIVPTAPGSVPLILASFHVFSLLLETVFAFFKKKNIF